MKEEHEEYVGHPDLWGIKLIPPVEDINDGFTEAYCNRCGKAIRDLSYESEFDETGMIVHNFDCDIYDKKEAYENLKQCYQTGIWDIEKEEEAQRIKQMSILNRMKEKK